MRILTILLLSALLPAAAQYDPNPAQFTSPLEVPVLLAGTFGELRSNHFHSGIDIKTQQQEGLKILSIGDGYISRIRIQHFGFGKAVYVQHPSGHTSVYAHLQRFSPEIEAFVRKKQYEVKSYEIDLYPEPNEIQVQQKQLIAFSGNTGSSAGPHLHFEIRDINQNPLNPLHFGFDVADKQAPQIKELVAYPRGKGSTVAGKNSPVSLKFTQTAPGTYVAETVSASGILGFGINSYDQQDLTYHKNGVYQVEVTVDETPIFRYDFDTFSFDETLYINTLIDYQRFLKTGARVQKCFLEPFNKLSIYNLNQNNGELTLEDGREYKVEIKVSDLAGNVSTLRIPVKGVSTVPVASPEIKKTPFYAVASRDNIFELGPATVFFPANSLYEDTFLGMKMEGKRFTVHHSTLPLHKTYTLSLADTLQQFSDPEKVFIATVDGKGRLGYQKTYRKDGLFSTRTKHLGSFTLAQDTVPPVIRPLNFKDNQWLSNYRYLKLGISDNLSGMATYEALIDGEWVLMEYEYKNQSLTFDFENLTTEGPKHLLEVRVTDNVGNSANFKAVFYRK